MNETRVIRLVAQAAPWLAPIPSGYFVARSSFNHLLVTDHWLLAYPIAAIIGLMIEMLGVASVHTLQDLNRWNRQPNVKKEKGAWESAPTGAAWLAIITYFGATFALLLVLETLPVAATVAPFLFPLIAIAGAVVWSVRSQHDERKERFNVNDTLKPGSAVRKDEQQEPMPVPVTVRPIKANGKMTKQEQLETMLTIWQNDPTVSLDGIAEQLPVSKTTVFKRKNELVEGGQLCVRDGMYIPTNGNHA